MSYKLRAYRVAGGATCPEAIIFYLLLYVLLYILKHVTRNGRVAANELHEVLHATRLREALLSFLSNLTYAIASPPNAPACRPTHSMGPASLRDVLSPLHLSLTLSNRSRYLFCCPG